MHLKDIEAAVSKAHKLSAMATASLAEVLNTIAEPDHQITVRKQLEGGTELVSMATRIDELEIENAKLQGKK